MAKSASLVFLLAAFAFAATANGKIREGQGLAIAQCTASSWVNGYPAGDNTGFCSQPAFGNIGGTVTDGQLANAYSGVGTCAGSHFVTSLARNAGPSCGQPSTVDLSDTQAGNICTWTPADASGASLSFSSVSVGCTKIGNIYYVYGRLTYPTTTSTASAQISGLPGTVANQTYATSPTGTLIDNVNQTAAPVPIQASSTFIFHTLATNTGLTNANLSAANILFSFFFTTE